MEEIDVWNQSTRDSTVAAYCPDTWLRKQQERCPHNKATCIANFGVELITYVHYILIENLTEISWKRFIGHFCLWNNTPYDLVSSTPRWQDMDFFFRYWYCMYMLLRMKDCVKWIFCLQIICLYIIIFDQKIYPENPGRVKEVNGQTPCAKALLSMDHKVPLDYIKWKRLAQMTDV